MEKLVDIPQHIVVPLHKVLCDVPADAWLLARRLRKKKPSGGVVSRAGLAHNLWRVVVSSCSVV